MCDSHMKLWLLRPVENPQAAKGNPWEPWYNKAFGFVVRAETEEEARKLADGEAGDENRDVCQPWLNAKYSSCVELKVKGEPGVVIRDFAAA